VPFARTILTSICLLLAATAAGAQAPAWIWHSGPVSDSLFARKKFHVHNRVRSAELRVCADDGAQIFLNGRAILPPVKGRRTQRKDVTSLLRLGRNVLAAKVEKDSGERGFIALLVVTLSTGKRLLINTDASWKASAHNSADWYQLDFNDAAWPEAKTLAPHGARPWGPVLSR